MEAAQVVSMLRWVNEVDPRVQFNDSAVEFWLYSLRTFPADVAKQAVLEHYKAHESIAATPGAIGKRAANIRSSREAGDRAMALEPSKAPRHPLGWRARNPELWDELFEQGRAEGNEVRRSATAARDGSSAAESSWVAA